MIGESSMYGCDLPTALYRAQFLQGFSTIMQLRSGCMGCFVSTRLQQSLVS